MHQYNVPQFIALLKERNFPIDGMQMEVVTTTPNGIDGLKGIVAMEGEDRFSLAWCKWECFLLLLASFEWRYLLEYMLPYCCGLRKMEPFVVDDDMGKKLYVIRSIKYR